MNGETFNVGLSNPLGMVQILTTVTPPLDPPQSLPAVASGMFFQPRVGDANFPFKIVATDVENNVLEFEAPLVFVERDHNIVDGKLEAARNTYNTHALVDREFDLKGQKVAYADSVKPDDTMLSTSSLTFNVAIPIGINVSQDEPRFVPVLDEAQVVVPAMSALTGDAAPQRVKYQKHYAKQGFASNAVEAFLEFPTPPGMKFAGKGDRSGGFVTPSLNVKALSRATGPISGDIGKAVDGAADFNAGKFFEGISAKLFGLIELPMLLRAVGFDLAKLPKFVTQTLDVASTLTQNAERLRNAAQSLQGQVGALGSSSTAIVTAVDTLLADLGVARGRSRHRDAPEPGRRPERDHRHHRCVPRRGRERGSRRACPPGEGTDRRHRSPHRGPVGERGRGHRGGRPRCSSSPRDCNSPRS